MVLKLSFGEFELDDVVREAFDKSPVDRGELARTQKSAFEAGVFVCQTHLLKFEALGSGESSKKIDSNGGKCKFY